jgi:hypothetical protein
MTEPPRVIAEFSEYAGFIEGLRARVSELNVAGGTIDEIAGYASGYTQKLLGVRQVKRLGMRSMGDLLGALGLKAQLVEDPEAMARVSSRLVQRRQSMPAAGSQAVHFELSRRFLRKIAAMGGKARAAKLTPRQRSALGRKLANHRWHRRVAAPSHAGP